MIDYCIIHGDSTSMVSNASVWLCKQAVSVNQNGGVQCPMGTRQQSHHNIDVNKTSTVATSDTVQSSAFAFPV